MNANELNEGVHKSCLNPQLCFRKKEKSPSFMDQQERKNKPSWSCVSFLFRQSFCFISFFYHCFIKIRLSKRRVESARSESTRELTTRSQHSSHFAFPLFFFSFSFDEFLILLQRTYFLTLHIFVLAFFVLDHLEREARWRRFVWHWKRSTSINLRGLDLLLE